MKAYIYLDTDGKLHVREKSFIDIEFPQFWSQNQGFIEKVWPIDTDIKEELIRMCKGFEALRLKTEDVLLLLKSIGVSKQDLKENASSL